MYNEDDAVAKLDGYVISVAGAGNLIGRKRMVRIEEVGRNAANATIVGVPAGEDEDEQERKARRRGRRGGRGRGRRKQEALD